MSLLEDAFKNIVQKGAKEFIYKKSGELLKHIDTPLLPAAKTVSEKLLKDKVKPKTGSIVYCFLGAGFAEHSGVYIGNDEIVHLNGDGEIEAVSPAEFVARMEGLNPALFIYAAAKEGKAVGSGQIAERAKAMIGSWRDYHLLSDNCHQFTCGCISGDFENSCSMFPALDAAVKNMLSADDWLMWDRL
jgi:hypothetical protein